MPDEKTRGDAIRWYLTGASSHAGAQTDPDASLGNHQSSTEEDFLTVSRASSISNITIDHVSGANGTGNGTLTATGSDKLTWTPPGGAAGTEVTILNGETKIIEGNNAPEKFVRVTRTSATALSGTETDTLSWKFNNVHGFDNVSSSEVTSGDDEYRCLCIENVGTIDVENIKVWVGTLGTQATTDSTQLPASGAGTITTTGSFADWPDSGFAHIRTSAGATREIVYYTSRTATALTVGATGRALLGTSASAGAATDTVDAVPPIRIGLDAPTSQPSGSFVDNTGVGEGTAPGGVVFSQPLTEGDGLSIGTLQTLEIYGIWIHRHVVAGSNALPSVRNELRWSFDAA